MFRNLLNCVEAMIQAVTYLLVLVIGLTATALGAFFVMMLAFRLCQFMWYLIFQEPWI